MMMIIMIMMIILILIIIINISYFFQNLVKEMVEADMKLMSSNPLA